MELLRRSRRVLAALVVGLAASTAGARAEVQTALATAVKASYLYKFAPFVDWPASVFAGPSSPFVICVVGQDPFGSVLDRAVTGQRVGGRAIVVTRLAAASHDMACQIAFIGGSHGQSVGQALQTLRGAPVLTVTDGDGPTGVVGFTLAENRIRFRIDDEAAGQDGLTISSKLLDLALKVNRRKASGINP
jgi:hypothetical protein